MDSKIVIKTKDNNDLDCNILIKFKFDNDDYIVYTDNTYNNKGEFNLYRAMIKDDKLYDVIDADVIPVFEKLIKEYKVKVIRGEI